MARRQRGEAASRRAGSTAYYAAYHHIRGLMGGRRTVQHRQLQRWLNKNRAARAGDFRALRRMRLAADYRIDEAFEYDAREACATARLLLDLT